MAIHMYKFGGPPNELAKRWRVRAYCGRNVWNDMATPHLHKVGCKTCRAAERRWLRELNRRLTKDWTNE